MTYSKEMNKVLLDVALGRANTMPACATVKKYGVIAGEDFIHYTNDELAEKLHHSEICNVVIDLDSNKVLDEQELEEIRDEWRERE